MRLALRWQRCAKASYWWAAAPVVGLEAGGIRGRSSRAGLRLISRARLPGQDFQGKTSRARLPGQDFQGKTSRVRLPVKIIGWGFTAERGLRGARIGTVKNGDARRMALQRIARAAGAMRRSHVAVVCALLGAVLAGCASTNNEAAK